MRHDQRYIFRRFQLRLVAKGYARIFCPSLNRFLLKAAIFDSNFLADFCGWFIAQEVGGVAVMAHPERLLMATLCANEYLNIQFRDRPAWVNLFEPQLPPADVTLQGGWRLNKRAHVVSFCSSQQEKATLIKIPMSDWLGLNP